MALLSNVGEIEYYSRDISEVTVVVSIIYYYLLHTSGSHLYLTLKSLISTPELDPTLRFVSQI